MNPARTTRFFSGAVRGEIRGGASSAQGQAKDRATGRRMGDWGFPAEMT